MSDFAASLISIAFHGLAYGMVLYVVSVGLSITMGLMGFVNLAHGVFAMTGGLVMASVTARWGAPFPVGLALAFAVAAVVSAILERTLYARLYSAGELSQVLFTMGLIFVSMALARLAYGTTIIPITLPLWLKGQATLLGRPFPAYKLFVIFSGFVIAATLWWAVERTRLGALVRAAVDDRSMAQSIGIDVKNLFTATFALGGGVAGLGGAIGADLLPVQWSYPIETLVYFMIVVAVGGRGSVHGPFAAALLIGLADTAGKYWLPEAGAFLIYAATIGLLLIRPQGLFGARA